MKAIAQPIEVGVNIMLLNRATFQQVVKMNDITVLKQRGWSTEAAKSKPGLTGAMAGLKGARSGASTGKDVRETPEEVAARLNRSFKVCFFIRSILEILLADMQRHTSSG